MYVQAVHCNDVIIYLCFILAMYSCDRESTKQCNLASCMNISRITLACSSLFVRTETLLFLVTSKGKLNSNLPCLYAKSQLKCQSSLDY